MRLIILLVSFHIITVRAFAQDPKDLCKRLNELNYKILTGSIKKKEAADQFAQLITELGENMPTDDNISWVFPLQGYNYHAIGGTNGNGYSDKGYDYLDGNKHAAHPAHDIFIRDKNQDCIDDRTHQPVNVLAIADGIVIACADRWDSDSQLRGGKFIWIFHRSLRLFTYYAHNSSIFVRPGDIIKQGQKIAEVGRTGLNAYKKRSPTHLHFSAFRLSLSWLPIPFNPYPQLTQAKSK